MKHRYQWSINIAFGHIMYLVHVTITNTRKQYCMLPHLTFPLFIFQQDTILFPTGQPSNSNKSRLSKSEKHTNQTFNEDVHESN